MNKIKIYLSLIIGLLILLAVGCAAQDTTMPSALTGFLANVTNVDDTSTNAANPTLELDGALSVTTAVVGGATYLFVAGYDDDGVSVFSVNP